MSASAKNIVELCAVASDSTTSRRMLASSAKIAEISSVVEAYDLKSLWQRLTVSHDSLPDICVLYRDDSHVIELLGRIRSTPTLETLPVIIVTPQATAEDVMHAMERDADDYLVTPLVPQQLRERAHGILARRRNPSPFEAALLRGKKYIRSGEFEKAGEAFDEALQIKPTSTSALFYAGLAFEMQGDITQAEELYKEAVQHRLNLLANQRLCAIYFKQKRYQEMQPLIEILAKYVPLPASWLCLAAIHHLQSGKAGEAAKKLRQAHRAWVADPKADSYTPLDHLIQAIQTSNANPEIISVCASVCIEFERNRKLVERLDFKERVVLGSLATQVQRYSEARFFLNKALDLAPNEEARKQIHAQLAKLYKTAGVDRLAREHARIVKEA
ncbi:MAG: tetratricopeptide repeat protein [Desulfosoma sp.]